MRTMPFAAFAVIAAGVVTVGSAVVAQTPQAAPGGARPDRAARWQEHKAEFEAQFDAMKKRRADDVALLIGLRADQRPAFDTMMAAMETPHHGPGEGRPEKAKPPLAPEGPDESMTARLDHMSARIDDRSAEAKAKLAAVKAFYAGLSPEQRLRFDALDRLRHDHDRTGPHGGWDRHGHGGAEGGPDGPPPPPMG